MGLCQVGVWSFATLRGGPIKWQYGLCGWQGFPALKVGRQCSAVEEDMQILAKQLQLQHVPGLRLHCRCAPPVQG